MNAGRMPSAGAAGFRCSPPPLQVVASPSLQAPQQHGGAAPHARPTKTTSTATEPDVVRPAVAGGRPVRGPHQRAHPLAPPARSLGI
jgi:hypothetical protein